MLLISLLAFVNGFYTDSGFMLLLASPDVPFVSCAAVGLAVAVILNAVVSSLGSLLWLKSQLLLLSPLLDIGYLFCY